MAITSGKDWIFLGLLFMRNRTCIQAVFLVYSLGKMITMSRTFFYGSKNREWKQMALAKGSGRELLSLKDRAMENWYSSMGTIRSFAPNQDQSAGKGGISFTESAGARCPAEAGCPYICTAAGRPCARLKRVAIEKKKVLGEILQGKYMYRILHTEWSKGWGGQEVRIIQESLEFMKRGYGMMIACQPGSGIQKAAQDKGIPVISTFLGGIEDVITNGQTGILVPPADARALSDAILWVYQNREESGKMALKAKGTVWKDYSFGRTIERTEEVYKSLLESDPQKRIPT